MRYLLTALSVVGVGLFSCLLISVIRIGHDLRY